MIVLCLIVSLAMFETNAWPPPWPTPPPQGPIFPTTTSPVFPRCLAGKQCGQTCCKGDEVCNRYAIFWL